MCTSAAISLVNLADHLASADASNYGGLTYLEGAQYDLAQLARVLEEIRGIVAVHVARHTTPPKPARAR